MPQASLLSKSVSKLTHSRERPSFSPLVTPVPRCDALPFRSPGRGAVKCPSPYPAHLERRAFHLRRSPQERQGSHSHGGPWERDSPPLVTPVPRCNALSFRSPGSNVMKCPSPYPAHLERRAFQLRQSPQERQGRHSHGGPWERDPSPLVTPVLRCNALPFRSPGRGVLRCPSPYPAHLERRAFHLRKSPQERQGRHSHGGPWERDPSPLVTPVLRCNALPFRSPGAGVLRCPSPYPAHLERRAFHLCQSPQERQGSHSHGGPWERDSPPLVTPAPGRSVARCPTGTCCRLDGSHRSSRFACHTHLSSHPQQHTAAIRPCHRL